MYSKSPIKKNRCIVWHFGATLLGLVLVSRVAAAEPQDTQPAPETAATEESSVAEPPSIDEIGDLCSDNLDNDGDEKVDCEDSSCAAMSWCQGGREIGPLCADGADNDDDGLVDCQEPSCKGSAACQPKPELGLQCRDGIDNNGDGLTDCYEPGCQDSPHCQEEIFYIPVPQDKPAELLFGLGIGFAFPNWKPPKEEVTIDETGSQYVIPYSPDVGPIANLYLAHMFTSWFGVGIQGLVAGAWVQSKHKWYDEDYKFDGIKLFFHAGGFVRFQYPGKIVVPYFNLAAGYTFVQYRWVTFSRFEETGDGSETLNRIMEPPINHATFSAELGLDVYFIERFLAVGVKAWAPFASTHGAFEYDNTALMLCVTVTPFWPEEPQLKPEYLGEDE